MSGWDSSPPRENTGTGQLCEGRTVRKPGGVWGRRCGLGPVSIAVFVVGSVSEGRRTEAEEEREEPSRCSEESEETNPESRPAAPAGAKKQEAAERGGFSL
ncbi:basic leucine zipper transcriptional factor ATF-like 3 isoform X3 [Cyprinodon tularosa]|uniref:basic leucine zipper transcriptional factor ATF-like 3 isoform X3 n=1 Tax=Cyprinodon tularosa TaxID=77115 RepID=UPI0018E25E7A|nr:basic leucine zipper transcriptional factor ATF-like 3 isoform X3 [Cyprinodon tularosa]